MEIKIDVPRSNKNFRPNMRANHNIFAPTRRLYR